MSSGYDKQVIRRRRVALGVLLGISLLLITAYFGEGTGGALHAFQRGAQTALAPIENGASRAIKPFRDLVGWTGDVFDAKSENKQLRKDRERLQRRVTELEVASRDAQQLRRLAGLDAFTGYPQGTRPVTARVIARSPTVWYSAIQIDKGSSDGIRKDMPVVAAGDSREGAGLAGRVVSVTGSRATVMLITDAESAVSAEVFPDGASGIVKAEVGKPNDLLLDFIQKGRRIKEGNTVVTSGFRSSGLESLFPRGIPIGTVRRVDQGEVDLYQRVHITPFADLRRMDFVQVLTERGTGQRAQAPSG